MNLNCPHFNAPCSGCTIQENISSPPILNEATYFFKELFDYPLNVSTGSCKGWRVRAKLAVRNTSTNENCLPIIGLFKQGTHEAVDIPVCQVQHPRLNEAADCVRAWLKKEVVAPYVENTGSGIIRYIQISLEIETSKVQLAVVVNKAQLDTELKNKFFRLQNHNPSLWHSIWVNLNNSKTNTIFGNTWEKIAGEDWLKATLLERSYFFHPASFMQANLEQYEILLKDMKEHLLPNKKVVEFYAGIGVIGLSMLSKSAHVTMSEYNKEGQFCFEENKKRLTDDEQNKIEYLHLDARKGASLLADAEVVIVDPPRKGVEPALMEKIMMSKQLEQLIWVSCGWPSFKREAEALKAKGFKLDFAKSYLFFPGTNHLEILAIFTPSKREN